MKATWICYVFTFKSGLLSDDDDSRNAVQISIIERLIESSGGLGHCGHIRFASLAGSHGNFAARSLVYLSRDGPAQMSGNALQAQAKVESELPLA